MFILTGGAGFIGSVFLSKLNSQGISEILVVDSLGRSEKWKNLLGKTFHDYMHKDAFLVSLSKNDFPFPVEFVIHLGACTSTTEQDAEYLLENNYRFSRLLAEWAIRKQVPMLYASSAATYGDGLLGFSDMDENPQKLLPLNIYGYSKHLFDLWALQTGALKLISGIKFFNVFGPNEYHKGEMTSVIYKAFLQIQAEGCMRLFRSYRKEYADGEQRRDFIYVKDCVEVLWWFVQNPSVKGLFNLGTGECRTWNDVAKSIFTALKREFRVEYVDMPEVLRDHYQYFTQASIEKLRIAGYSTPFSSLEHSVRDYVKNYLLQPSLYL